MKKTLTTALICLASLGAMADEKGHAIDIRTDKIVINTDSLNLPMSTTAYEVLTLLPDLIERPTDFILNNYTIQINGKTVGSARDAVLNQIRISDLKNIEVCENSLSAVSAMGQGGSISLELRDATKGLTGSVNAEVTSEMNYSGGLRLDNNNGKWNLRTVATVENYVPRDLNSSYSSGLSCTTTNRDFSEFVSAFIEYHPTAVDLFKLNLTETYTNSRTYDNHTLLAETAESYTRTRNINAFIGFNYEHTFPTTGKLCVEVNYRYTPEKCENNSTTYENSYNHKPNNVYGELKLEQPLFRPTPMRYAILKLGAQYNYSGANNKSEGHSLVSQPTDIEQLDVDESTYYLRPFAEFDARFNKWQLYGVLDYQHFSYETKQKNSEYDKANNRREDITGQAVVIFHPDRRNDIRLRYMRSIQRPSASQLYPYPFIDPGYHSDTYLIGNMNLTPMLQNTVDLDYSLDLSTANYHLEMKAGAEYSHNFDMIDPYEVDSNIRSYINKGKMDVLMGDLGIYFRKGIFSAWFSGNVYHNHYGEDDHHTYYNLLLRPVLNLPHQWILSLSATYNSAITESNNEKSHNFFGDVRLGKTWGKLNAYVYAKQNFSGRERDTTYSASKTTYLDRDYMLSYFGAGVCYRF